MIFLGRLMDAAFKSLLVLLAEQHRGIGMALFLATLFILMEVNGE